MTADVGVQRTEASLLHAEQALDRLTRKTPAGGMADAEPAAGGAPHHAGGPPPPREPRRPSQARLSARRAQAGDRVTLSLPVIERLDETPEEIAALQGEIRDLRAAAERGRPGAQLPARGGAGRRRLRRRLARPIASGGEDAGGGHHLRRRALHGGDRGDPVTDQARAPARPQGRLLARGYGDGGGRAPLEGEIPRLHRRGLREHHRGGEGRARLLLHQRQRARRDRRDPRGPGHSLPTRLLPRRPRAPDAARTGGSRCGWASATCTRVSGPRR